MQLQQIAERCKQGDREAFARLYTAMRQPLRAVCLSYVHDEAVADDLLHDAFLLIFFQIGKLKDCARAEAWMTTLTHRVSLLYLRRQRQHRQESLSLCAATSLQPLTVENSAEPALAVQEILAVVDSLPEGYRQVFRLSVLEGMSHQEIAALLHIEPHSSSSQLARAKRILKQIITKYWVVPLLILIPATLWLLRPKGTVPGACPPSAGDSPSVVAKADTASSAGSKQPNSQTTRQSSAPLERKARRDSEITETGIKSQGTDTPLPSGEEAGAVTPSQTNTPAGEGCAEAEIPINSPAGGGDNRKWTIDLAYNLQPTIFNNQSSGQLPYADAETNPLVSDSVSRHHLPLNVALSVGYRLNRHWQLGTGLNYTRLTSDFCSGNSYVSLQQHQTVQYLGIPVSVTYHAPLTSRLSLLTSAATTLHLPLSSTLESHYLLPDGTIAEPTAQDLRPGLQWSVGLGLGLQYELTPHVGLFVQPSLEHYWQNNSGISTWNTEHPFVLSVPFGIIISF